MYRGVERRFPGPICPRSYQPGFFAGATKLRPSLADVNFRIPRKPLSAENHTAYRPVRFTSNIVMSSSLHLGSTNNFRLEIVFAGLSDMAPRKRLSGSFPEIESVNPSVNRRRVHRRERSLRQLHTPRR